MKKIISLTLALILAFSLSTVAFAATTNYGTVTVNSRHADNSINQVTLNSTTSWTAANGNTFRGTFYITFPKGTQYQTPSAEQCWRIIADSYFGGKKNTGGYRDVAPFYSYNGAGYGDYVYQNGTYVYAGKSNGDYVRDGQTYKWVGYNSAYFNGNQNQGNQGNSNNNNVVAPAPSYVRTASQQAAENQFDELRKYGESYGWSVDFRPSASVKATDNSCWYLVTASRPTSGTETTYFSFSVYTEKSGSSYSTRFKVFENGNQVGSYTLSEVEGFLKQYGASYGTLPCNVFKVTTASATANAMIDYLKGRSYSVSATSNGYTNDAGSSTLTIMRSGYDNVVVRLMVEKTADGWFRCNFARNGATLTTLELLTLFR